MTYAFSCYKSFIEINRILLLPTQLIKSCFKTFVPTHPTSPNDLPTDSMTALYLFFFVCY